MKSVECQMMMKGVVLTLNEMTSVIEETASSGNITESGSEGR